MWKIILANKKAEIKTACKIVHAIKKDPTLNHLNHILIVQDILREFVVELTQRINKKT